MQPRRYHRSSQNRCCKRLHVRKCNLGVLRPWWLDLARARPADLSRSMSHRTRWDLFFKPTMTLADGYHFSPHTSAATDPARVTWDQGFLSVKRQFSLVGWHSAAGIARKAHASARIHRLTVL